MKAKIKQTTHVAFIIFFFLFSNSCNEDEFLKERPKDFLSPDNAFVSVEMFEAAIGGLHRYARDFYGVYTGGSTTTGLFGIGTDLAYHGNGSSAWMANYAIIDGTDGQIETWWDNLYAIISQANTIIERSDNPEMTWDSDTQKNAVVAEAMFFRAWAYKILANLWGGVPIVDTEVNTPKVDFIRNTRTEVYEFAKQDLDYAVQYLPEETVQDGRIVKAAAYHVLAEVNISLENWDAAISAASAVIDDPNYELMTQRFGSKADWSGDVFWDLFRMGNQNRSEGNKESLWVLQMEWETPGGGSEVKQNGWPIERVWGPRYWRISDPDGKSGFIVADSLGRPVAQSVITNLVKYYIWREDWNDMRNSEHNMKRKLVYNNPASAYYGQVMESAPNPSDTLREFYPYMAKISDWPHPGGIFTTGRIFRDIYVYRLAETYLLRAEAYLGKNDKVNAAADINVVRARANTTPVSPGQMDIDYILDERARELITESMRRCTLQRLGLLDDRVRKYNPFAGPTIEEFNNLFPIPQREIDLNFGGVLEQNPGY